MAHAVAKDLLSLSAALFDNSAPVHAEARRFLKEFRALDVPALSGGLHALAAAPVPLTGTEKDETLPGVLQEVGAINAHIRAEFKTGSDITREHRAKIREAAAVLSQRRTQVMAQVNEALAADNAKHAQEVSQIRDQITTLRAVRASLGRGVQSPLAPGAAAAPATPTTTPAPAPSGAAAGSDETGDATGDNTSAGGGGDDAGAQSGAGASDGGDGGDGGPSGDAGVSDAAGGPASAEGAAEAGSDDTAPAAS